MATATDQDADNYADELELGLGLDPANADTDADGVADGDELNLYGTDPLVADTDGDGVFDGEELFGIFTDPAGRDDFSAASGEATVAQEASETAAAAWDRESRRDASPQPPLRQAAPAAGGGVLRRQRHECGRACPVGHDGTQCRGSSAAPGEGMKITAVRGYPVKVGHRNQFVVTIETDEGITGVGEGGISGRELAMQGMLEHFGGFLSARTRAASSTSGRRCTAARTSRAARSPAATLSAVDIALWDILGKSLGVPVYQLLGGACRERVHCFATPGRAQRPRVRRAGAGAGRGRAGATCASSPAWATRAGPATSGDVYEPFESIELAVHWLGEIRRALGAAVELSIDFHHRLSVAEAALFCQRVEPLHLHFVEEPIRAESAGGVPPAAEHDPRAVRDRRGVLQQVGIRSRSSRRGC